MTRGEIKAKWFKELEPLLDVDQSERLVDYIYAEIGDFYDWVPSLKPASATLEEDIRKAMWWSRRPGEAVVRARGSDQPWTVRGQLVSGVRYLSEDNHIHVRSRMCDALAKVHKNDELWYSHLVDVLGEVFALTLWRPTLFDAVSRVLPWHISARSTLWDTLYFSIYAAAYNTTAEHGTLREDLKIPRLRPFFGLYLEHGVFPIDVKDGVLYVVTA